MIALIVVNTTATGGARSPFVVLNSYIELRFASPQTTIVLTVQGVGSFSLELLDAWLRAAGPVSAADRKDRVDRVTASVSAAGGAG